MKLFEALVYSIFRIMYKKYAEYGVRSTISGLLKTVTSHYHSTVLHSTEYSIRSAYTQTPASRKSKFTLAGYHKTHPVAISIPLPHHVAIMLAHWPSFGFSSRTLLEHNVLRTEC